MNGPPGRSPDDPDEAPIDDPLDVAFAAYLRACDAGETSSREEFIQQFPELADDLSRLLDAADLIGQYTSLDRHEANLAETAAWDMGASSFYAEIETVVGEVEEGDRERDPNLTLPLERRAAGDARPMLPFELGDYRLERVLGRGGMGVVYLALQRPLDRYVAVKMIRSGLLAEGDEVRRFFAEARAAAKLRHANIVAVYQFGELGGHHFFSMEYVPGTDLAKTIEEQPLDPMLAARYVRDVARAIDYAHRHGVLHRDLKPGNVLIDSAGQVHVTDFGLSKQIGVDSSLTGSGMAVGTPAYMAPEQARGHSDRATQRTDVYALGAILFACLTGRPPFQADTVMHTMMQVIHKEPPRLTAIRPDAPRDLETICAKCLEKIKKKRYKSAGTLADDLDRFLNGQPITARPRSRLLRAVHWVQGVPLVAAVTGHRVIEVSAGHRRFQAAMLMLIVLIPFLAAGSLTIYHLQRQRMPDRIRIAGGLDGGVYSDVSREIGRRLQEATKVPTEVIPTNGSIDNRQRLLGYEIDMAPIQAGAMTGSELRVAAPLFYEAVHILVRSGAAVEDIDQLPGHQVAVGPQGSGSRLAAEYVFDSLELTPDVMPRHVIPWPELSDDSGPDVAVICVGRGSSLVADLLAKEWKLLPLDNAVAIALQHPSLRPMRIEASDYPNLDLDLPPEGISTVGTIAFLAVRADTPDILVTETLKVLYQPPPLLTGMISRRNAAEWQGLSLHRAARAFYSELPEGSER